MEKDELLTPEEVAEYLKVPVETIWRWCRNGDIPAIKIGKYWRIPEDELRAFIKAKRNLTPSDTKTAAPDKEIDDG